MEEKKIEIRDGNTFTLAQKLSEIQSRVERRKFIKKLRKNAGRLKQKRNAWNDKISAQRKNRKEVVNE